MDQPPGLPHHFFTTRPAWPVGAPMAQPSTRHDRRTSLDLRLSGGRRLGLAVVVADGSPMAHLGVVTGCGYRGSSTTCSAPRSHLARGPCARENRIPNRCDKRDVSRARNEGISEGLTLELHAALVGQVRTVATGRFPAAQSTQNSRSVPLKFKRDERSLVPPARCPIVAKNSKATGHDRHVTTTCMSQRRASRRHRRIIHLHRGQHPGPPGLHRPG